MFSSICCIIGLSVFCVNINCGYSSFIASHRCNFSYSAHSCINHSSNNSKITVPRNIVGSDGFQWVLQIMQQPSNTYNFFSTFCSSSNNALLLGYVALNSSTSSLAVAFPFHLINCNRSLHTFLYNLLSVACAHCSLM